MSLFFCALFCLLFSIIMEAINLQLSFTKMHGIGNDYIYINGFTQTIPEPHKLAVRLSDRHVSIGGDGVILILPSDCGADARMRIFNADGSEGKMCGNGIRCVGKYVYEKGLCRKDVLRIQTESGIKTLYLTVEDGTVPQVRVDMGAPILNPAEIPARFAGERAVRVPITVSAKPYEVTCVSMGNPHMVLFTTGIDALDLPKIGPAFETHQAFPEQVNTEFVEVIAHNHLRMRVWERGSGETMACGTGACAVAVASVLCGYADRCVPITVDLRGGTLSIVWDEQTVWMQGPAAIAFEGTVEVEDEL